MKAAPETSILLHEHPPLSSTHHRLQTKLARVEALMQRIARGGRVDRTGAMALSQLESGGKRFRARLTLLVCDALRVPDQEALRLAAAVELLHNATLIHDDIQDEDTSRRGHPTLWVNHGVAQAINAGDYMLMLPFLALGELESERRGELCVALAEYATRIVRGQVEELGLRAAGRFDWESYLSAAAGKTGALLALPVLAAARIAGLPRQRAEALAELFVRAGVLFQLQDDIVDLYGDKGRDEVGCDIYEGKISALVVAQLERSPHSATEVLRVLDLPRAETTPEDVARMQELFLQSGALEEVIGVLLDSRDKILGERVLLEEARLKPVVERLLAMALAPVSHLLPNEAPLDSGISLGTEVTA